MCCVLVRWMCVRRISACSNLGLFSPELLNGGRMLENHIFKGVQKAARRKLVFVQNVG